MTDPHSQPITFVTGAEGAGQPAFTGGGWKWSPSASPDDPHQEPFEDIGESLKPVEGEVPANIQTGGPGPFGRSKQGA